MKRTVKHHLVAAVLLSALSCAQAASYVIDVQFPDDTTAMPIALNVEDFGKPQTANAPSGLFVAVAAQHALQGKLLQPQLNVIDNASTEQASGTTDSKANQLLCGASKFRQTLMS